MTETPVVVLWVREFCSSGLGGCAQGAAAAHCGMDLGRGSTGMCLFVGDLKAQGTSVLGDLLN